MACAMHHKIKMQVHLAWMICDAARHTTHVTHVLSLLGEAITALKEVVAQQPHRVL